MQMLSQQHQVMPILPTEYSPEALASCHMQEQSLLFSVVPRELRSEIFRLACAPYDDAEQPYRYTDYFYRPGHHAKIKSCTSMLYTCRRAWIEASHLPLQLAEPTFWMRSEDRQPKWTRNRLPTAHDNGLRDEQRFLDFMHGLTARNRSNLKRVHIFAQMYWLEQDMWTSIVFDGSKKDYRNFDWPPEVKITIRHTDWWFWERGRDLSMKDDFIGRLLGRPAFQGSKIFVLDLETLRSSQKKVDQLKAIIKRIKRDQNSIGHWAIEDNSGLEIMHWTRPGNIDGAPVSAHNHLSQLDYCVYRIRWRNTQPNREGDMARQTVDVAESHL
jgi:hypothetical protein